MTEQRKIGMVSRPVDEQGATAHSRADAPEIDGIVRIRDSIHLAAGSLVKVKIESADDYDLFARTALHS